MDKARPTQFGFLDRWWVGMGIKATLITQKTPNRILGLFCSVTSAPDRCPSGSMFRRVYNERQKSSNLCPCVR